MLDLTKYEVIDNHNHPFPEKRENKDFALGFCIGLYPVSVEAMKNTIYYNMVINELKRLFNMPDATEEEIVKVRNEKAFGDRKNYVKMLLDDAGYKRFLVDFGYPIGQKWDKSKKLKPEEIQEMFEMCSSIQIHSINRIEWVANALIENKTPFSQFEERFYADVRKMVKDENLIALKSVIAYYTGLEVKLHSEKEVKKAYYRFMKNPKDSVSEKIFRDYVFVKGCHIAHELQIPLQVHTGLGDSPDCNLLKCNPFLLHDVLNTEEVRDTKIMLIHGSYPYLEELGMIVNHYENVFCDISSFCPYASIAAEEKITSLFELAPLNKVCFGTDGTGIPEHAWFGAVYMKRILAKVLNKLVAENIITEEFAEKSAKNILSENAKRIYNLK